MLFPIFMIPETMFIDTKLILTTNSSDELIKKTKKLIEFSNNNNVKKKLMQHSRKFVNFQDPDYKINILKLCNTMLEN